MTRPALPDALGARLDLRRALIAELEAAEAAFLSLPPDEAIHAGRVRLKRVRALARVAMEAAPWTARRIGLLAREIMAGLSQARDLGVLEQLADHMAKRAGARAKIGLRAIAAALSTQRARLPAPDLAQAASEARSLIALARALPTLNLEDIDAGLARLARRRAKAGRRARGRKKEALRHEWRKREKDWLYALRLLGAKGASKAPKASARLCAVLGHERDALLLRAFVLSAPFQAVKPRALRAAHRAIAKACDAHRKAADALAASPKSHRDEFLAQRA